MKSPPYPLPLEERLIGVSVAMTKEKKKGSASSSFIRAIVVTNEHLPNSHSGVSGDSKRRILYASQGHRAKSLSNAGTKGIPRKDTNTLFICACLSPLSRPTRPAILCWFPAKHVCRALYALSSLACRYLPRFDAATVACSSRSVALHFHYFHLAPQILKSQTCAFGVINQA